MCDASPSSGYEVFAVVEGHFEQGRAVWRWLPFCYLGFGRMGLKEKTFNMLWALYLESGTSFDVFLWHLDHVRSITTDRGTEKAICDVSDCIQAFCAAIGLPQTDHIARSFLFQNAVWIPGWHHLIDRMVQDCLEGLPFFRDWIQAAREICSFLRIKSYRAAFCRLAEAMDYDSRGFKKKPPAFANWRWATLWKLLEWLVPVVGILRASWANDMFSTV